MRRRDRTPHAVLLAVLLTTLGLGTAAQAAGADVVDTEVAVVDGTYAMEATAEVLDRDHSTVTPGDSTGTVQLASPCDTGPCAVEGSLFLDGPFTWQGDDHRRVIAFDEVDVQEGVDTSCWGPLPAESVAFTITEAAEVGGHVVATELQGSAVRHVIEHTGPDEQCEVIDHRVVERHVFTLRLVDPAVGTPADSRTAAEVSVPLLPTPGQAVGQPQAAFDAGRSNVVALVPTVEDVPWGPADVLAAALLAIAVLFLVVFPSTLFNSTFSAHYDQIAAGMTARMPRLARRILAAPAEAPAEQSRSALGRYVAMLVGAALLFGLLDPGFGPNRASVVLVAGFIAGLVFYTGVATAVGRWLADRVLHRDDHYFKVLPWSLAVGAVCVVISRSVGFLPGYLYVLIGGLAFTGALRTDEAARNVLLTSWCLVGLGVAGWLGYGAVAARIDAGATGLAWHLAEAGLAATFAVGIQGSLFRLVPLEYLAGHKLYHWSRGAWLGLYATVAFLFAHVIARRKLTDGGTADVDWFLTLLLFGVFGLASVAFWAYWRRRDRRDAEQATRPATPSMR